MWGITTSRPRHCLKIGAQALAWGEAVRTWRGRYHYRCALSPAPPEAIKLSPMDLNLTDMPAVESRLRSLAGSRRDIRVAGRVWLSEVPASDRVVVAGSVGARDGVAVRAISRACGRARGIDSLAFRARTAVAPSRGQDCLAGVPLTWRNEVSGLMLS